MGAALALTQPKHHTRKTAPKISVKPKREKLLSYPGGDWYIKDNIIELLRKIPGSVLVEVFGGSGVIATMAPRDKFKNIIYNDKDSLLTNFYRQVKENPEQLRRKILMLPISRELRQIIIKEINNPKLDPVTKAAFLFYLNRTGFNGKIIDPLPVRISTKLLLHSKADLIPEYAKIWRDITIENKDWRDIIAKYDSPNTIFYLDPPFISTKETQNRENNYRLTFTWKDLEDLARTLKNIKGKYVLKLPPDNYNKIKHLLDKHKYHKIKIISYLNNVKQEKRKERPRKEVLLITNYT